VQFYRYFESFASIILYAASQRVFIFVSVYCVIDSVRKRLDTPSYIFNSFLCITSSSPDSDYVIGLFVRNSIKCSCCHVFVILNVKEIFIQNF